MPGSSAPWLPRPRSTSAKQAPAGTGVLIEPDKVLTCRHVVATNHGQGLVKPGISVRLPGLDPVVDVRPEQDAWLGVDAVVLTLPAPAGPEPVTLSGSLRAPAKVELLGYPQADRTGEGVWRAFTVHGATRNLVQLDWTDVGSFTGHSGGPVLDADSGKLVDLREGSGGQVRPVPAVVAAGGGRCPGQAAVAGRRGRRGGAFRTPLTRPPRKRRARRVHRPAGRPGPAGQLADGPWAYGAGTRGDRAARGGQVRGDRAAGLQAASQLGHDPSWRGLLFHARSADAAAFRRAVADLFGSGADETPYRCLRMLTGSAPRPRPAVAAGGRCPRRGVPSADREQIATLAEQLARRPWVRAVVATRPLSTQGTTGGASLLRRLGVQDPADDYLLNLDSDAYFEEEPRSRTLPGRLLDPGGPDVSRCPGTAAGTYRADSRLRRRLARVIAQILPAQLPRRGHDCLPAWRTPALSSTRPHPALTSPLCRHRRDALDQFLDSRQDARGCGGS